MLPRVTLYAEWQFMASYHHGDLKNALIAAARVQIEKQGAASLNLRVLAKAVGVTHPAVYRHFSDKETLLLAVAQRGFEELAERLEQASEVKGKTERLRSIAHAYVGYVLEHRELCRVMFTHISAETRMSHEELYAASKRAFGVLVESTQGSKGDFRINSAVVWAMFHGVAELIVQKQMPILADEKQRNKLIDKAVSVLSKGI
jgi:AcrR family transcriptional regulator